MRKLGCLVVAALVGLLNGCGSDEHSQVINATLQHLDQASSAIAAVVTKTSNAVKAKEEKPNDALNLAEAMEATKELKKVGESLAKVQAAAARIRDKMTPEQRHAAVESNKTRLNEVIKQLRTRQIELNIELDRAAKLDDRETEKLRLKIIEAQSGFEALNRAQS
jgi:hypothetical protein